MVSVIYYESLYIEIHHINVSTYLFLFQIDTLFENSSISDIFLGSTVEEFWNISMGVEAKIRIDLVYGTQITLMELQMAFVNGLTGRDMDFVEPDSRVLRHEVNVSMPSEFNEL